MRWSRADEGVGVLIPCEGGGEKHHVGEHTIPSRKGKLTKAFIAGKRELLVSTPDTVLLHCSLNKEFRFFFLGFFCLALHACNMTNPFPDTFGDGRLQLALS